MSSTEKGVLWLSGNLAASGCISAPCGRIRTQVELSVPVLMRALYMGLQPLHTPLERMQIYISFKKKVTQMKRCVLQEQLQPLCFLRGHADTLRPRGTPVWALQNVNARSQLGGGGGALSRLFIAGHLVKMCPLSFPPCPLLCFFLSLFANVRFYAGRTRERRLWC